MKVRESFGEDIGVFLSRGCFSSVNDGEVGRLKMEVGSREWWGLRFCGRVRWD